MAQFSDLPNEIANHMLSLIERSDLPNLCLVDKRLQSLAEPFLYSTIVLHWDCWHVPSLVPLLCTLFQRPELFSYIDTLCTDGQPFESGYTPVPLDVSTALLDQFSDAIRMTQVSYASTWVDKLRAGSVDAFSGLLISCLTEIRNLTIGHNFINGLKIIGKVLQSKAHGQLPRFRQLNHMIYFKEEDYNIAGRNRIFEDTISLFYIPTITDLKLWLPNPPNFYWPAHRPNLDHLTSVETHWLCPLFLTELLNLTSHLKNLLFYWDFHDETGWDPWKNPLLELDQIMKALSPAKNTLETLHFRIDTGGGEMPWRTPRINISGSLHGFEAFKELKFLEFPLVCVTGTGPRPLPLESHLPENIQVLRLSLANLYNRDFVQWADTIRQSGGDIDDEFSGLIRSLAEKRPERFPRLQDIEVCDSDNYNDPDLTAWAQKYAPTIDGLTIRGVRYLPAFSRYHKFIH